MFKVQNPLTTPVVDVRLPPTDAWATEVLQSCARAHYTPQEEFLKVLAPLRCSEGPATAASPGYTVPVGKVVDVEAEENADADDDSDGDVVLASPQPDSTYSSGSYQPYLHRVVRAAPSAEMQTLRATLSPALLRKAYRLQIPCVTAHTTKAERLLNCAASPRCMSGLRTLGGDAVTREDCLRVAMGEGPRVVALPTAASSVEGRRGEKAPGKAAVSASAASSQPSLPTPATAKAGQKAARASSIPTATAAVTNAAAEENASTALASTTTTTRTVAGDATFPCLWRGVRNLMNTCYFSSILQMVFSVASLRRAILADSAAEQPHNGSVATPAATTTAATMTQLDESGLKELFALMAFSREGAGADPKSFATYLSLDVKVQQDAQEFFTLLLDWLRCHCGPAVQAAVTSTFSGTLLYDRRCGACGRSAKRAEPFLYLSLPVRSTLEDSLSEFSKPEEVDGFMCEGCGKTATATSRQYMRTLPDVLVVHWNRFEFDMHTLQRHKVTTATSFPLQLDMAAYMRQWHEQKRSAAAAHAQAAPATADGGVVPPQASGLPSAAAPATELEVEEEHRYELRGVVNHHGDTAVSGHYTYHGKVSSPASAAAAGDGASVQTWLNFNDAEVSPLNRYQGQRGVSSDAYLLVYHRVSRPPAALAGQTKTSPTSAEVAAGESTCAAPAPAEFPLYLRQYVDQVNQRCLAERQEWLDQRAQVAALYDLWAATAQTVFDTPTSAWTSPSGGGSGSGGGAGGLYALPTAWLQQLGRFFLPTYMDVAALGGGVESQLKRNKKDAASGNAKDGGADASSSAHDGGAGNGTDGRPNGPDAASTACEEDAAAPSGDGPAEGVVVSAMGPRRHGYIQSVEEIYQLVRQHSLLQSLPSLQCTHGYLAPWGPYKLISAAAFAKLTHFLAICGAPLKAAEQTGSSAEDNQPPQQQQQQSADAPDAQSACAFADSNLCPLCVAAMAATVRRVAEAAAEDEQAELCLTQAWHDAEKRKEAESAGLGDSDTLNPPSATAAGEKTASPSLDTDADDNGQVLVSETVIEGWASYYVQQLVWNRVRQAEGYTAVVVMKEARLTPPRAPKSGGRTSSRSGATSPSSPSTPAAPEGAAVGDADTTVSLTLASTEDAVGIAALNVDRGDLDLSAQLLCPHGALRPGQHVLAIPASLRAYWVRRFAEVLTVAHRAGQLRTSDPAWRVTTSDIDRFLLPYIPASTTSTTCPECMRTSVQTITSRHHQRLRKMEERRKFPSLWLAGAMTSPSGVAQLLLATGAENEEQLLAAQHPNRLFFRHNGEREYRDYVKKWTEAQQARIALQEAEVTRLQTTVAKKKEHDAAWNARVTSRRGGRGGRGGTASPTRSSASDLSASTAPSSPPDPETLEGRLYYAEEALAKLRGQPVPDFAVAYGCVPTWWVARWYAAMQDDGPRAAGATGGGRPSTGAAAGHYASSSAEALDGGAVAGKEEKGEEAGEAAATSTAQLPPLDFQVFKCEHGGCLLDVPWLNPSDGFWQGVRGKRAEVLWNGVQVERATVKNATSEQDAAGASSASAAGPGREEYRSQCWLPPLVILPMEEYMALLAQYGSPDMVEKMAASNAPAALQTPAATDRPAGEKEESSGVSAQHRSEVVDVDAPSSSPLSPVPQAVVQVGFHNGVRQLHPAPCPTCCAKLLADFEVNCESFVNGSLKLNLHIKKSRKNFYDAMTVLTSAAVQQQQQQQQSSAGESASAVVAGAAGSHAGVPITIADVEEEKESTMTTTPAAAADVSIPDGIHHYTTLAQLRLYISAHLRKKHGYLVPPEELQIARGKNKPLKLRAATAAATTAATSSAPSREAEAAALEAATLHDLGIRDGDTLSVQSVDNIAQTCATAANADEEWEAIPPELLQAGGGGAGGNAVAGKAAKEHSAAFRETRLQGSLVASNGGGGGAGAAASQSAAVGVASGAVMGGGGAASPPAEEQGVACAVCTFLNAPGMVVCEMCEAPLPTR